MSVNRLFHLLNETNNSCPDFKGQNYKASFHTRSSAKGPRKKTYRAHLDGEGPRKGEHAVVKVFRHAPGTESMCDTEIAKHVLARKFARKFNKMVPESRDKITFTLPLKSTVEKFGMGTYLFRHSRHLDKQEWVLIEENLVHETDHKFELFLRKNGDRPKKDPSSLDAFLHFSYFESGQKFVLCGFQGIHTDEEGYKLSTPCFHSTEKRWGLTDKGQTGMKAVFAKHKCNNLCYSWPKPSDHLAVDDSDHMSSENETDEAGSSCDEATRVESSMAFSVHSTPVSRNNTVVHVDEPKED